MASVARLLGACVAIAFFYLAGVVVVALTIALVIHFARLFGAF